MLAGDSACDHLRSGWWFWLAVHTVRGASGVQTWASSPPPGSPLQTGTAQRTATAPEWPSYLEKNVSWWFMCNTHGAKICFRWIVPLVLFRKIVATRSFQGSWKRVSCTRLKGDRGGVHFLKAFLLGGLRPEETQLPCVQNHKHDCLQICTWTLPSLKGFLLK